ncbi:enolase C-terminal domain-like protein [Larkinella soli]|uniref:enolase C-terminal domain-like protein n=1 Tax=Larkinella soli TaxID=1770527 RepID=UPI000FFBD0CF|nr:enolase C-terminal domain-like protein [Larkinella soli]
MSSLNLIRVARTDSNFEREPLIRSFGFKGGYLTELWQVAARLEADTGRSAVGLATQSVLYGDADLFAAYSEAGGNALMYALVERTLLRVRQSPFFTPMDLLDRILPEVMVEAHRLTGKADLHPAFIYNALISVDNAAWGLYAAENGYTTFDELIPEPYRPALSHRSDKVAVMYQIPYGMPVGELRQAVAQGYFVLKIKTGYPGSQEEMVRKDMERLTQIHRAVGQAETDRTPTGKVVYTLDANARYERKETLLRYLDHAKAIGALDRIVLIEEPLREENEEDVSDLGIPVAGDESVHDEAGALRRLDQGYRALVLKGVAKTLSLSLKLAKLAHERGVPCLCADLTVNPILVDWHKNLAARLAPFPGLGMGLLETNGDMNYRNWSAMQQYHPAAGASWTKVRNGVFELDDDFYRHSGGILNPSDHYEALFRYDG